MNLEKVALTVPSLSPQDTIADALALMHAKDVDILPVVEDGEFRGAVRKDDLLLALCRGAFVTTSITGHILPHPSKVHSDQDITNLYPTVLPAFAVTPEGNVAGVVSVASYAQGLWECLNELRDQFISIMDSAMSGIIAIDREGIIVLANRMAEELLELGEGELMGRHILDVIPHTRLMEVIKCGKPLMGQKFTGPTFSCWVNYAPVMRNGEITGAIGIFNNISNIENISEELDIVKRLNRELEAIIHSSYDGIWITDGEARVLDINEAYERITGIRKEEVIGRTMYELVEDGYFDQSATVRVIEEQKSVTINQTVRGGKQILVTGNPIYGPNGELFRVVTNVRDITELATIHEQLAREKERAQKYKAELTHLRSRQIEDSELVFRSKLMNQVVELAMKVADVDSTLLITGESGTGKELVAKLIHRQGKGDAYPFISINCGAIPEQLLESELFGYEGGAFTGAKREGKPGLFELAHEGTLFLDEVAELPLAIQVKILRAIQEKTINRIGATKGIHITVRIIAATHRDLAKMMREGTFREDLYYRLMVVPIYVPPLRERKEDVPLLIHHFLDHFNKHFGYAKTISPTAVDKLVNYAWPGNVRELKT